MNQDIINEALEQIDKDVLMGFDTETEMFDGIQDMFYDEDDFDEDWLRRAIAEKYARHQQDSLTWQHPTDFEKLSAVFDALIGQKIVCLHKAGYTKQDGEGDCEAIIQTLQEQGIQALGYCYYHTQDLERAIDPDIRNLFLGFDSATRDEEKAISIAHTIVAGLAAQGFEVNWNGEVGRRIEIKNIRWQKIPDQQDWGAGRVLAMIMPAKEDKKPFWKFW